MIDIKRHIRLTAAALTATAALTACTSEEIAGMEEQPISFGSYIGKPAAGRGYTMTTDNLPSMGVYAFYTGQSKWADWTGDKSNPNFMNHQLVNRIFDDQGVATGWEYTPVKYWPTMQNDKLTFFAYAPCYDYQNNPLNAEWKDGEIVIHYNWVSDTDLMYAYNQDELTDLNRHSLDGKVHFKFKHAMARIDVQARLSDEFDENTSIVITKVGLSGGGKAYGSGDFHTSTGTWTNCVPSGKQWTWSDNALNQSVVSNNLTTEYQSLIRDDQIFFAIPQNYENDSMKIYIDYTITTTDSGIYNG